MWSHIYTNQKFSNVALLDSLFLIVQIRIQIRSRQLLNSFSTHI